MEHAALPFYIRPVASADELAAVIALRAGAYGRRDPALGAQIAAPDPDDHATDCVVLAAVAKSGGAVEGTLRIHRNSLRPLPLEASVALPPALARRSLAEVTRLAKRSGADPLVKLALFKAFYQYCKAHRVEVMVVAGRAPLDQQYEALMFEDVFPDRRYIPMEHAGGIPHRVLALDVPRARSRWGSIAHPLLPFMVETRHPDIQVPLGDRASG
jgi:hypothetical protein